MGLASDDRCSPHVTTTRPHLRLCPNARLCRPLPMFLLCSCVAGTCFLLGLRVRGRNVRD